MKNKFEALKAFMNWPREWQELCAEFFVQVETGEPANKPQPQRAAKAVSMQGCKPIYRGDFGIIEREYLAKCHHETRTRREAANMFLDRYPGRSVQAVEIKIRKMLDANGVVHVGY